MDNMNPTKELNMAITATFAINASDELRARLKDDDELVDFVVGSCFRNNTRTLVKVETRPVVMEPSTEDAA